MKTRQSLVIPWVTVVCKCGEVFCVGERKDENNHGLDSPGVTWRCPNPECNVTYRNADILEKMDRQNRAEFGNLFAEPAPSTPAMSAYDAKLRE